MRFSDKLRHSFEQRLNHVECCVCVSACALRVRVIALTRNIKNSYNVPSCNLSCLFYSECHLPNLKIRIPT